MIEKIEKFIDNIVVTFPNTNKYGDTKDLLAKEEKKQQEKYKFANTEKDIENIDKETFNPSDTKEALRFITAIKSMPVENCYVKDNVIGSSYYKNNDLITKGICLDKTNEEIHYQKVKKCDSKLIYSYRESYKVECIDTDYKSQKETICKENIENKTEYGRFISSRAISTTIYIDGKYKGLDYNMTSHITRNGMSYDEIKIIKDDILSNGSRLTYINDDNKKTYYLFKKDIRGLFVKIPLKKYEYEQLFALKDELLILANNKLINEKEETTKNRR